LQKQCAGALERPSSSVCGVYADGMVRSASILQQTTARYGLPLELDEAMISLLTHQTGRTFQRAARACSDYRFDGLHRGTPAPARNGGRWAAASCAPRSADSVSHATTQPFQGGPSAPSAPQGFARC